MFKTIYSNFQLYLLFLGNTKIMDPGILTFSFIYRLQHHANSFTSSYLNFTKYIKDLIILEIAYM